MKPAHKNGLAGAGASARHLIPGGFTAERAMVHEGPKPGAVVHVPAIAMDRELERLPKVDATTWQNVAAVRAAAQVVMDHKEVTKIWLESSPSQASVRVEMLSGVWSKLSPLQLSQSLDTVPLHTVTAVRSSPPPPARS